MVKNAMTSLIDWQKTVNGKKLLAYERSHLTQFLKQNFVDRMLQISGEPLIDLHAVHHYVLLQEHDESLNAPVPMVQANINLKLPFRDESFQTIVICHAHERVSSLPALFEEVERLLLPEGNLIVYGINFTSLWAVAVMFNVQYVPFCHRLFSDFEIKKNLKSLGFQYEYNTFGGIMKPENFSLCFDMAYQAHYTLVAKKTLSGLMFNAAV